MGNFLLMYAATASTVEIDIVSSAAAPKTLVTLLHAVLYASWEALFECS